MVLTFRLYFAYFLRCVSLFATLNPMTGSPILLFFLQYPIVIMQYCFLTGLTLIMVNSKSKIACNLVLASSAALVGSVFQFGYNGGVINNAQLVITKFIDESNVER